MVDYQNETNSEPLLPLVLVNDDGIRPAGRPDECLYCHQKVGQPHLYDCVILSKKVKIKYTFDIEIEVPYSWGIDEIEFHRNESSWCATNAIEELKKYEEETNNCLCHCFHAQVIEIPNIPPYRRNKDGEIVN